MRLAAGAGASRVATIAFATLLMLAPSETPRAEQAGQTGQAGQAGQPEQPGDDLTIYALTFGPHEHPFFKFGHNAILVQPKKGEGLVFNFGTFAFDSPALIPKFLRGRFKYWLSVAGVDDTMESYAAANRSILAQELDLTAAQKWSLWQALRENARPENREYLYDYFYDNCSTRVRDAIDRATGGRVRAAGQNPASMTFRAHSLRSTADFLPEYVGLYLGLGRATDVPINRWQEAFLPERLADLLRSVRVPEGAGEKPLVKSEKFVFRSSRPAKPPAPPSWGIYFLGIGTLVGAALVLLGRLGRRRASARILLGLSASILGFVLGLLGLILVCLWLFTDHRAAHANANILQLAPWSLGLSAYGLAVALGRSGGARKARTLALSAAIFSAVGVICKAVPGLNQDNWPFVLLCFPLWLGMWVGFRELLPTLSPRPSPDTPSTKPHAGH
jgi:hypothetical protein